jgi:hypothetical protein
MHKLKPAALAVAMAFGLAPPVAAQSSAEINEIRDQLRQMRQDYESRIRDLEQRLQAAESKAGAAETKAGAAEQKAAKAEQEAVKVTARQQAETQRSGDSAFNPGINLILQGRYADLSQDPDNYFISGFIPSGGEVGPGPRGFSLAESELNIWANVDPYFRASFTAAYTPENEVEVEEAYFQTLALPQGFTLKGGRFFSGIGYLNEQHQHAWDFIDAPLPYRAFLGKQLGNDGVQLKWIAPTPIFIELGGEVATSSEFPGAESDKNGASLWTGFARIGGDLGVSSNWRLGLSYVRTSPQDRLYEDEDSTATLVNNAFTGTSKLWIADFVWKWAPDGNPAERNFKFQAEYFTRDENGTLTYDVDGASAGTATGAYDADQSGWYAQAVYQFMPRWRVGARYDRLDSGTVSNALVQTGALTPADFPILAPYNAKLYSAMVDWSPTEFSRVRLQYTRDESRAGLSDDQIFLQYILSLGSHGAHKF